MAKIKNKISKNVTISEICEWEISVQMPHSKHHLISRYKGGRESHAKFPESVLAIRYNSVDKLKNLIEFKKFVKWFRKDPRHFYLE